LKTYQQMFEKVAAQYRDVGADRMFGAFKRTIEGYNQNPFLQNRRVKTISSFPEDYDKDKVAAMLRNPYDNEAPLRQVSNGLLWTAYPYRKITKTYQDLLTYRWYVYPQYAGDEDILREWALAQKAVEALNPKELAHKICGQAARMGRTLFFAPCTASAPDSGRPPCIS